MNKFAFAVAVLMAQAGMAAEPVPPAPLDHLTPEDSPLSGGYSLLFAHYHKLIVDVLGDAFNREVQLRAVVLPSFSKEYVVGIRALGGFAEPTGYRVFYLRPEVQLWGYENLAMMETGQMKIISGGSQNEEIEKMKAGLPKSVKQIKVQRCEKTLDAGTAVAIKNAWIGVLYETRYERRDTMGLDGVSYHFSAWSDFQLLAGSSWSPDSGTKPGMLADLASTLTDFCDGTASAATLEAKAQAIEKRLSP